MKLIFGLVLCCSIASVSSAETVEERLAKLENKVQALEKAVSDRLSDCKLVYKRLTYRLNVCDRGTFVRAVTNVGANSVQLDCGYYELQCGTQEAKATFRNNQEEESD